MQNTEIIFIGTFHHNHGYMQNYHFGTIKYLLTIAKPDILAVEIRPKDLQAKNYSKTPFDIAKVVIPWAQEHGVRVSGIDYWKNNGRKKHNQFMRKLKKSKDGSEKVKAALNEIQIHKDGFPNIDDITLDYVHSEEFAAKDYEVRQSHTRLFGEGPGNLFWYTRANEMNALLADVIKKSEGKRIVVVTGAGHRGDFERFLANKSGIRIIPLSELDGIDNLPTYESYIRALPADELLELIMYYVQGQKANNDPDSINLRLLDKLLAVYKTSQNTEYLDYFQAEYFYLNKQYAEALASFQKIRGYLKGKKFFGLDAASYLDIRIANMLDLLGKRDEAVTIYKRCAKKFSRTALLARYYLANPCKRLTPEAR